MRTKRFLSVLLAMTMLLSMFSGIPVSAADAHGCDDEANCLVCNVADLINALPAVEDITVENAAEVTDQIHAIDRIKFDLTDEQYYELLTLVDTGADESGEGLVVPVRYKEAVKAINELGGGGWFAVSKKFVSADGSKVDVKDAEVDIKITNVDTKAETVLTLATLGTQTSELGADYYTENADGWTYKYMLPTGTYVVEEVADSGAIVDGKNFVTSYVTYNGENVDTATITVSENDTVSMLFTNVEESTICVYDAADETKEILTNAKITIATENVVTGENTVATSENGVVSYLFDLSTEEAYYVGVSCEGYEDYAFTITNDSMEAWFGENSTCYIGLAKHINYYIGAVASNQEPITSDVTVTLTRADTEQEEALEYSEGVASGTCAEGVQYTLTMSAEGYKTVNYTFTAGTADTETTGIQHVEASEDAGLTGYAIIVTLEADNGESEETHSHPVCGATCDGDCGVAADGHTDVEWTALTQEMVDNSSTDAVNLSNGNYYLETDIELNGKYLKAGGNVNICLNGKALSATGDSDYCFYAGDSAVVNFADCGTTGKVDGYLSTSVSRTALHIASATVNIYGGTFDGYWRTIYVSRSGNLTLYNGTIQQTPEGGAYGCVEVSSSTFYMYGGKVANYIDESAVLLNTDSAIAYIYGGELYAAETAVLETYGGKFHFKGAPVFTGDQPHVLLKDLSDGGVLYIDGRLTGEPIKVDVYSDSSYAYDFTSGWSQHMSDAYAPDYFVDARNSNRMAAVNETTGELHFVEKSEAPIKITVTDSIENGTVTSSAAAAKAGTAVALTVEPDAGYEVESVTATDAEGNVTYATVDSEDATKYTFTMPSSAATVSATFKAISYKINISGNFVGGTVTADKAEATVGETVTFTATPVDGYELSKLTVTDAESNVTTVYDKEAAVALFALSSDYTFTMPATDVTVDAVFTKATYASPYTVNAVTTNAANVDKDTTDDPDNLDVYADDIVKIDVTVTGDAFTNADWTLIYDSSKFEYQSTELHTDAIEVSVNDNVISGKIAAPAAKVDGDEYEDGTVVATYIFKALPHTKEVTGIFNITEAHANNYVMAGNQDNTPAATAGTDVTILLVKDDDLTDGQIPSGTIEDKTTEYNAQPQGGNAYVLDEKFTEATVAYAANADGSAVVDDDGDGDLTDEIAALDFRTTLPTWKPVGTYTYYVRITGDGLATVYDSAVLNITPVALTPSARFEVDPAVDKVTIIPTLEGVIDGTHNGTVTITYADENGAEQTATYNASDFAYDGETTSVYTGTALEVKVQTSGDYTIKIDYNEGTNDNYTGEENTATVNVDKLTASDDTVNALEDTLTNVFPYNAEAHTVEVDTDALASIKEDKKNWTVKSITDAYTNEEDPTVTNVGDEVLVKVVFEDTTGVYNDVTVYVALKVTPAEVTITLDDQTKAAGEDDPELTYIIEVLLADGTTQNALFGSDDLDIKPEREPGETAGTYNITASYVPNDNYKVTVVDGDFVIDPPKMDGDDAQVKIEVVDLSMGNTNGDITPDYISDKDGGNAKRLILIYTDLDKAYFTYEGENFFDVTAAGYMYVENNYEAGTFEEDTHEYKHVYGLVVDAIGTYEAKETYEALYKANVKFAGSDAKYAPVDIIYDADINLSETEVDVNDYSMTNGIYNAMYDRVGYMISILKADTTGDKRVDTDDAYDIKADVEAKN